MTISPSSSTKQQYCNLFKIALNMLTYNRKKFIGMLIGATFATFILTQQPSIYQGITERLSTKINLLSNDIDLWIMSDTSSNFEHPTYFNQMDIYRIRSVNGVQWATQLYETWQQIKHIKTNSSKVWQLIGVDRNNLLGLPQKMQTGDRDAIRYSGAMIIDGYSVQQLETKDKKTISLGDKMVRGSNSWFIAGITKPLRSYSQTPTAYLASHYLPDRDNSPSFILVKVNPSFDISAVAKTIKNSTGYLALTTSEFIQRSNKFFREKTPILVGFIAVAILGFVIGLIIIWQIFNDFVLTHQHQYGMLKMLGVTNPMLIKIVLFQASFIGSIGFILGLGLSIIFGLIFHNTTVAFDLTWQIILLGLLGSLIIIICASVFSLFKVIRMDTVDLCRSLI